MRLLAVHGIATGASAPVARQWMETLGGEGVHAHVENCRWPSTGTVAGDVAALGLSAEFRLNALEAVVHGVDNFATEGFGVLVGHSMGTVLVLQAERMLRTGLPIVLMASPLSSPPIHAALAAMGLARPPLEKALHLWNDDDPIPGGKHAVQPTYFDAKRIAVANNDLGDAKHEHDVRLYLKHSHTITALKNAWGSSN